MYSEKEIQISPAEWQMWRNMPTTVAVMDALMNERSVLVQRLALGDTLEKAGSEIKETAIAVGTIQGLTIVLDDFELTLQQQWQDAAERKKEEMEEGENE